MIAHGEAQALISARLDGPLTAAEARDLQAHLATCPSCRRFAEQVEALARGLRELPHLPPSPNVTRQVLEAIEAGRSPLARLSHGFPAPMVAVASGLVLVAAAQAGCQVAQYTPNEVKQAVAGYGSAPKEQVQRMVQSLLGLAAPPRPPDAADALALALCHLAVAPFRSRVGALEAR